MIDFTNPIDPLDHVKIERIKPIGSEEENEKKELAQKPVTKKLFLYLTFLKILSNSIKFFKNPKKPKEITETPLQQELQKIKSSLEALKENDLCQDTQFMNLFAFTWMKFLKDLEDYTLSNPAIASLIKKLISEINDYPKGSDFSLGYYISEFAGYKWIPFPYMEILRNLHLEYKKKPQNSNLQAWTDLLDEMLSKI
jgi:hypothetical protein